MSNQLCLGIIASGIGFMLTQRTPFRFRDIRQRLWANTMLVTQAFSQDVKILA